MRHLLLIKLWSALSYNITTTGMGVKPNYSKKLIPNGQWPQVYNIRLKSYNIKIKEFLCLTVEDSCHW